MELATSDIEKATGEAPHLEKLVVWFAVFGSPIALVGSVALAAVGFRWWAFITVPVMLLWWFINRGISVIGTSRLWPLSVLLIVAASVHFMRVMPNPWMSASVGAFVFAIWCDRLVYCGSTFFLRAFVLRNQRALEAYGEAIDIREAD
jgi:hypothetical protein